MRSPTPAKLILLAAAITISACSNPPYIPAPWDSVEPQSEPPTPTLRPAPPSQRIGSSVRGKAITATTLGSGPKRVYLIGGIHGDEPEAPAAAALLPELLTTPPAGLTIRLIPDMNPDGTAAKTRTNTRRVDLERNWPARDFIKDERAGDRPLSELETAAIHADLKAFNPDIIIVLQSANHPPTVAAIGPVLRPAHEFARAARSVEPRWRFNPRTPAPIPGSLESLYGRDQGKTVIRVEFQRNKDAATNAKAVAAGLAALTQ